ncbi:MAG: cytochrome P450 [Proteobacteria bacterium]|nr:cytochrome P450 [Pseudomonadota bacterium]
MSGPVGYPAEGFDLANVAIQANPFPAYAWLRANAPVYRLRDVPMWVVSRHEEVEAVLRDPATFASDLGMSVPLMSIVMKDAPDHTRLRGTINRAFTPRAVQHLAPRITEVAHALLDRAQGRMEFVHGYANPLSVTVICEMLGVPLGQRDAMNRHSRDALLASFAATGMGSAELLAEAREGLSRLMAILDAAIEAHLRAPSDNIISTLVADEAKGVLSREELRNLCALLLIGGHETTANLIASGASILAETPALWRQLKEDPALIAGFVEELARLRPPLQRIARRATRAITLAGVELPANAMLMLFPGSANRDPARWHDPDTLDLKRDGRGHLGFGTGIHTCPGGPLARMEARIAFEVLLARSDSLRLDPDERAIPVVGYAAGNLGWNVLPVIRTEAKAVPMQSSQGATEQDVLEAVCAIAATSLGLERSDIDAATCAKNTPEWDSLAHLVILDAIEKALAVKLPRRAAYTAKDVGELVALVVATRAG